MASAVVVPLITPDNHKDQPPEEIGNGVTIRWLDGGRILITRLGLDTRACYDTWENYFHTLKENWPSGRKTLYAIYDMTSPQFGVTMYMLQRVRPFILAPRPYTVYGAALFASNPLSTSAIFLLRSTRRSEQLNFSFFTERERAMSWLYYKIQRYENS